MKIKNVASLVMAGMLVVVGAGTVVKLGAQPSASLAVAIDTDDIGGVARGARKSGCG